MNARTVKMLAKVKFFHAHAPGIVGEQMSTAIALARAEERAQKLGFTFVWEDEQEDWDGDVPLEPTDLLEWCACYQRQEICQHSDSGMCDRKECAEMLASLSMFATTGYSDPYRRVVEAELALEALEVLDKRTADRAAAYETERVTFGVAP